MRPMVFVPLAADELRTLSAGSLAPAEAYAATPGLLAAYGFGPGEDEEADHAAQVLASLACVRRGLPRLVAAAEVAALPPATGDSASGGVRPGPIAWRDVQALFVDDPDDLPATAALEAAAAGDLAAIESHPLLWFAPSEAGSVLDLLTPTQGA